MPPGWQNLQKSVRNSTKNVGLLMGDNSGFLTFYIDVKNDVNPLNDLVEGYDVNLDEFKKYCFKFLSQSGGYHYVFKYNENFKDFFKT